jgi:hypothetical protein
VLERLVDSGEVFTSADRDNDVWPILMEQLDPLSRSSIKQPNCLIRLAGQIRKVR